MPEADAEDVVLQEGYWPGAIADVLAAHTGYYGLSWGFGLQFEAKVATELSDFLTRYQPGRDVIIKASGEGGRFMGSIIIDGCHGNQAQGAHLRWFITTDGSRGKGVGRRLMAAAVQFCDERGYKRIYLTTFAGLDAARHLYESFGFVLISETSKDDWSGSVGEQRFERQRPEI